MQIENFYSHGKLLLTGEYVVLDGASAIALPSKLGQSLKVERHNKPQFEWRSYLKNGELWQKSIFSLNAIKAQDFNNTFEKRLFEILSILFQLKPHLFEYTSTFTTKLDFEKDWGLGSSSTLINNLAKWAKVNAFSLLDRTFGGSGYDVAAASRKTPFIYQRQKKQIFTENINLSDYIKPYLYFVYLNQKQNSREGIRNYRHQTIDKTVISKISEITSILKHTSDLKKFEHLITTHEGIISKIIDTEPVQSKLFHDYNSGIVKSLGAWGGDFVLVTAKDKSNLNYFKQKGYNIIFSYDDLLF